MCRWDITGQNKMKKSFIILIGAIVMLFAVSSCQKTVEQSDVWEISVEMIRNADGSGAAGIYKDLAGKFQSTDAVLVYAEVEEGVWLALPGIYGGVQYSYVFDDNGNFLFAALPKTGNVWTSNFKMNYRIVRIPHFAFTEKRAEGVNHEDYNEVMKAYNLYESNIIKK